MTDLSFRRERFSRFTRDERLLDKMAKSHDEGSDAARAEANEFIDSHSDADVFREYADDLPASNAPEEFPVEESAPATKRAARRERPADEPGGGSEDPS